MNEVIEFAEEIKAIDLREIPYIAETPSLFMRSNYFLLGHDNYLIIKISRSNIKQFWGLGKKHFDFFNQKTKNSGNYYFVALLSNKSGWVISKDELQSSVADGSISYSEKQKQFKINDYNLRSRMGFSSPDDFVQRIKINPDKGLHEHKRI